MTISRPADHGRYRVRGRRPGEHEHIGGQKQCTVDSDHQFQRRYIHHYKVTEKVLSIGEYCSGGLDDARKRRLP